MGRAEVFPQFLEIVKDSGGAEVSGAFRTDLSSGPPTSSGFSKLLV